jgi:hypothetical protein
MIVAKIDCVNQNRQGMNFSAASVFLAGCRLIDRAGVVAAGWADSMILASSEARVPGRAEAQGMRRRQHVRQAVRRPD